MKVKTGVFFIFIFFFCSCTLRKNQGFVPPQSLAGKNLVGQIEFDYAKKFCAYKYEDDVTLVCVEPDSRSKDLFVLFGGGSPFDAEAQLDGEGSFSDSLRDSYGQEYIPLKVPVENVYLAASAAASLLRHCDSLSSVKFSSLRKKSWYIEEMVQAMEEGRILFAGKYDTPDYELLLKNKCSLAIESGMIYHCPSAKETLESVGIPVFVDKSSYEDNPLGRMEWIKLYGLLTCNYDSCKKWYDEQVGILENVSKGIENDNAQKKSVCFFYISTSGMAVVRKRDDFFSQMIGMAGGRYVCPEDSGKKNASLQLTQAISMEELFLLIKDADVIIYNSAIGNKVSSKDELLAFNEFFASCKAFKSGELWATRKNFYQSADSTAQVVSELNEIFTENFSNEPEYFERLR